MRHNARRPKNNNNNNNNRNAKKSTRTQVFDSNGPDVRIRGTAHQVLDKYLALAKDARGMGDLIMAENYMQHAEHYQRIINTFNDGATDQRPAQQQQQPQQQKAAKENQGNDVNEDEDDLGLPASMLRPATIESKSDELEDA